MKKILMTLLMVLGCLAVHAEDYPYLTFETNDGQKVSVSTSSLTLSISGTTLTAGSSSFTLANLTKMYFSTSDETTAINEISTTSDEEITAVYDLRGNKLPADQMNRGVYIVKTNKRTYKLIKR